MKLLGVLILSFIVWYFVTNLPKTNLFPVINTSPTPSANNSKGTIIEYDDKSYLIYLQKIEQPKNLKLIPNFSEKKTAKKIMQEDNCRFGANAGFYTQDAKPLGLYYVNGQYLNQNLHNVALFNGYVYQLTNGELHISNQLPTQDFEFAFQSGPRFMLDQKLNITIDEPDRRVLLGETEFNDFYFLALTETENSNSGPLLNDLPKLLQKAPVVFTQVINLDGGSASAFFQETGTKLQEIVPVGSFLCGM